MYKLNLTKFLRDKHPGLLCPGAAPAARYGQDHEEADSEEKAAEARDLRRQRGAQTENVPHTERPDIRRSDNHLLLVLNCLSVVRSNDYSFNPRIPGPSYPLKYPENVIYANNVLMAILLIICSV